MKFKNLILCTALFAVIFSSCSSDDPEDIGNGGSGSKDVEAKMISFGFYVEDNEGVIAQDYVINDITGRSISIMLPKDVDKSRLIARFTVSENDIVKVGDVVQESGKTENDFTIPVDYIVSEGTTNVRYTVTVGVAPDYVWTALPPVNEQFSSITMKVSPAGIPYIAYKMDREVTDQEALAVFMLKDGIWTSLGQVSEGRVDSYMDIAFNSKDVPAISYLDYTSEISRQASVKILDGANWSLLGNRTATSNKVTYHSINFADDNKLMLFATYDARDNVLARRELSVNIFEGANWTYNLTIPGRASDLVGYLMVSERLDDVIYLGVYNAVSPNTISVYKYDNNNWTVLIDKWTDEKATGINLRDFDIAVDRDGNVFVALADNSVDGDYRHRVIKYDHVTKEISNIGNTIEGVSGGLFNYDLAVSPLGVPFLFYRNNSKFPAIVSLDKDTQDWTEPHIFEAAEAEELYLDFSPDGKAYLAYLKENVLVSYQYDEPK